MSQAQADEFATLDATAQAELVRRKEVKPLELVEAAIKRIERINPTINAVITPMYELARATAADALPDGPFTGVPFLLKDLLAAYAGVRMASGSRMPLEARSAASCISTSSSSGMPVTVSVVLMGVLSQMSTICQSEGGFGTAVQPHWQPSTTLACGPCRPDRARVPP